MSAYFHLHSWMLFSTTALSALDFLTSGASEGKVQRVDENYMYSARQLFSNCVEVAVDYLVLELSADKADNNQLTTSSEAAATQKNSLVEASEPGKESLVSKIIGLIAALISPNNQSLAVKEVTEVLTSKKFLVALFDIARAEKVYNAITRHMALGLLGKLLQQMNISSETCPSLKSSESEEMLIVDPKAINLLTSLFEFGADCLTRHGLELAKSTSQVLNGLQMNPMWTQLLNHQFSLSVDLLNSSPTLSSIFALFAFTGFPDMLTVGTLVTHVEKNKEVIRSVVRLKKSDETMCTIVELNSRKKKRMKDNLLDVVANNKSFLSDNKISQCAKFIINIVNQRVIPGLAVDALTLWQLALIIKASLQSVLNNKSKVNLQLYENSFLQCLSHLASLGTHLPKSLLLSDLEVLSLKLNKRSQSEPDLTVEHEAIATIAEEDIDTYNNDIHNDEDDHDDDDSHDDDDDDNHDDQDDEDDDDEDDEDADVCDSVASSSSKEEDSDHQAAGSRQVRSTNREPVAPMEIIDNIPTEAERGKKKQRQTMQEKDETDTGIVIGQDISDLLHAEIEIDECIEEMNPEKPSLMSAGGDEDKEKRRKRKEKSSGLVEKLLGSKEKGLLTKVNRALGILYARKLLMALVSECQDEKALRSYINSFFVILPLLVGQEANGTLEKVIMKVVSCCQPNDVMSISVASSFFVAAAEGQLVAVSKQLPSFLFSSRNRNYRDEVYIPGAIALKVELDKSSCVECDVKLIFSSSSDFTKNRRCFSGRSHENWEDFTIAGDHLYCTLHGPELSMVSSNYHFKVTGIVSFSDHLDVGFLALSAIFDKPESVRLLPVDQLWKLLVNMANQSAKTKRLKAIQLLLKLMSLQTKIRGCDELSVDLSLLKGLWQMYQKMMEATKDSKKVQPALVLALTELFYVAQNVAMEWNVAYSYMITVEEDGSIARMKSQESSSKRSQP